MPNPDSHGARFAQAHGPSACAMAFRVKDAGAAYQTLLARGAKPFANAVGPMELNIPAIEGIGGSVIYLVDRYGEHSIYDVDFVPTDPAQGFAHRWRRPDADRPRHPQRVSRQHGSMGGLL